MTERNQVTKSISFLIPFASKFTKRDDMVNVQFLPIVGFCFATHLTGMIITSTSASFLARPVRAIIGVISAFPHRVIRAIHDWQVIPPRIYCFALALPTTEPRSINRTWTPIKRFTAYFTGFCGALTRLTDNSWKAFFACQFGSMVLSPYLIGKRSIWEHGFVFIVTHAMHFQMEKTDFLCCFATNAAYYGILEEIKKAKLGRGILWYTLHCLILSYRVRPRFGLFPATPKHHFVLL